MAENACILPVKRLVSAWTIPLIIMAIKAHSILIFNSLIHASAWLFPTTNLHDSFGQSFRLNRVLIKVQLHQPFAACCD